MNLNALLESTIDGLGYEFIDLEMSNGGRYLRIFIDKPNGITVDDCALVSNHLTRLLVVENFEYDRLEISSPGLNRVLKKPGDFLRFLGEKAQIKMRVPIEGRRNFVGILRDVKNGVVQLEVEGVLLSLDLANLDKARLAPDI